MDSLENLLISLSKGLVENKDSVKVVVDEPNQDGIIVYHLEVDTADKGRIIGKQGRIAKAIRVLMRAAANRIGKKILIEIV